MRRKQAEFLILGDLPKDAVLGYVVYNQKAKNLLLEIGVEEKRIRINEKHYFAV